MRVIVTGGAGFIGSHISEELINKGHDVFIIDNLLTGNKDNIPPKAEFFLCDIRSEEIKKIFSDIKPDYVFHEAAQMDLRLSVEYPIDTAEHNIIGSINLLECCIKNSVKKFVFASTGGAIYGEQDYFPADENHPTNPLSPYGVTKLTVEKYLNYYYEVFKLPFISLRYSNVYGPKQNSKGEAGVIAVFIDKLLAKEQPVINGTGEQMRDFVYVKDVVKANMLAISDNKVGCYNVGTNIETSINDIFRLIKSNMEDVSHIKESHGPAKKGEQFRSLLSYDKIQKDFSWIPSVNIKEGIKETTSWFKQHAKI